MLPANINNSRKKEEHAEEKLNNKFTHKKQWKQKNTNKNKKHKKNKK